MPDLPPIVILLAVYQGGAHLAQQLDSFLSQSHADWRLMISDDGSMDESRAIASAFRDKVGADRVRLVDGPRQGSSRNFLHLIEEAPVGASLAFSDQDDVWLPEKLARAATKLQGVNGPQLYCARTLICNESLQNRVPSRLFARPHGFRNALVQACTPGNTSVLNPAAASLLKQAAKTASAHRIEAHDWWAYQVVTGAGGGVIFDPEPGLLYRQHASNVMGRNDTISGRLRRISMLAFGEYGGWLADHSDALTGIAPLLSPENRELLARFGAMLRMPGPKALGELRRLGLYRQTLGGDAALQLAALTGRLRRSSRPDNS